MNRFAVPAALEVLGQASRVGQPSDMTMGPWSDRAATYVNPQLEGWQ